MLYLNQPTAAAMDGGESPGLSSVHISPRFSPAFIKTPSNRSPWLRTQEECRAAFTKNPEQYEADYLDVHNPNAPKFLMRHVLPRTSRLEWTENGNVVSYKSSRVYGKPPPIDGRGIINKFSDASRRRLLKLMESIDRTKMLPQTCWFITLTYPRLWPSDPKQWKIDLDNFRKRLYRRWGILPLVWKIEPQKRGAPHYHLLLFTCENSTMTAGMEVIGRRFHNRRMVSRWRGGKISEFVQWTKEAWYEIAGRGDEKHLLAGTSVEPMDDWAQAIRYAGKYLGKSCQFFERVNQETGELKPVECGRYWGVWHRDLLPITWHRAEIPLRAWCRIRRVVRKLFPDLPHELLWWQPRSLTVFVPQSIITRLLDEYAPLWRYGPKMYASVDAEFQRDELRWPTPAELHREFLDQCSQEYQECEYGRRDGTDAFDG